MKNPFCWIDFLDVWFLELLELLEVFLELLTRGFLWWVSSCAGWQAASMAKRGCWEHYKVNFFHNIVSFHEWKTRSLTKRRKWDSIKLMYQKSPLLGSLIFVCEGGRRIWTDDQAFAEPCLTTWLYRHNIFYFILKNQIRSRKKISDKRSMKGKEWEFCRKNKGRRETLKKSQECLGISLKWLAKSF